MESLALTNDDSMYDLREALRAELAASAEDLRTLKRWWRLPPAVRPDKAPATRSGLGDVRAAKRRATLLHLALAHGRRRLHLRVWHGHEVASLAAQAALLAEELGRLDKLLVTAAPLDEAWRARLRVILAQT
jgi:hypothetical protein